MAYEDRSGADRDGGKLASVSREERRGVPRTRRAVPGAPPSVRALQKINRPVWPLPRRRRDDRTSPLRRKFAD